MSSRQVCGSRQAALETLFVLQKVVSEAHFSHIDELLDLVKSIGARLVRAQPKGAKTTPSFNGALGTEQLNSYRAFGGEHSPQGFASYSRRVQYSCSELKNESPAANWVLDLQLLAHGATKEAHIPSKVSGCGKAIIS